MTKNQEKNTCIFHILLTNFIGIIIFLLISNYRQNYYDLLIFSLLQIKRYLGILNY